MRLAEELEFFRQGHGLQTQNLVLFLELPLGLVALHSQFEVLTCQMHYFPLNCRQSLEMLLVLLCTNLATLTMFGQKFVQFSLELPNLFNQRPFLPFMIFAEIDELKLKLGPRLRRLTDLRRLVGHFPFIFFIIFLHDWDRFAYCHHISVSFFVLLTFLFDFLILLQTLKVQLPLSCQASLYSVDFSLQSFNSILYYIELPS